MLISLSSDESAGDARMAYETIELNSKKKYEEWLREMGDGIKIISAVPTRKKFSMWTGMSNLENAQTYTVTFEKVTATQTAGGPFCTKCGAQNNTNASFCSGCGNQVK
jgi:hypothetical protein